ncbi:MAG: tetratricopeptide repeat protein [Vulcanimicrobiaceae bacterium]
MRDIPVVRRFGLGTVALVVSTAILHTQLSSAIVTSGDALTYRGQVEHALSLYRRALVFDPNNGVAADRFAFWSLLGHRVSVMNAGVIVSSAYLSRDPKDATVLMDRGLLEESLGQFSRAETDFVKAATLKHAASTYTFAGYAAWHAGHRMRALTLWRRAQALDPHYLPSRIALAKVFH